MEATRVYQELTARWAQSEVVNLGGFLPAYRTEYSTELSCARSKFVHLAWIMIAPSPTRTKLGRGFRCGIALSLSTGRLLLC